MKIFPFFLIRFSSYESTIIISSPIIITSIIIVIIMTFSNQNFPKSAPSCRIKFLHPQHARQEA